MAMTISELDRVLAVWKYVRRQIVEEDSAYKLDDETLQRPFMNIISQRSREGHERVVKGSTSTITIVLHKHSTTRSARGKWTRKHER